MNSLASPPLCVAYALSGRMDLDMLSEPRQDDAYLRDLWPSQQEIHAEIEAAIESDMFRKSYAEVFEGDENWNALELPEGDRYAWDPGSTYVKQPPYFEELEEGFEEIRGARCIAVLGDSVTTDHIPPAGAIKKDSLAGKEYGSGSSRDWAAKGPRLLGVRFVIAESYERIHRSNLVGMGVLPLQFPDGESVDSLGLTGQETFDLEPLTEGVRTLKVSAGGTQFEARVRIDTPNEWQYYRHGGILHYVLDQ